LVAAFFATTGNYNLPGHIYILQTPHVIKEEESSPFNVERLARFRPRHTEKRIVAQRGLFTVHPKPEIQLEDQCEKGLNLDLIVISERFKEYLVWDLARFGIQRSTLFPDLDGLCSNIEWMYTFYDPRKSPESQKRKSPNKALERNSEPLRSQNPSV